MPTIEAAWYGNASIRLKTDAVALFVDPYVELSGGENPNSISDFLGAGHILITHAHLDHLASLPELLRRDDPIVHCTPCAAKLLRQEVGPLDNIAVFRPGDSFEVGDIRVDTLRGQHVHFDRALILRTVSPANLHGHFRQALRILRQDIHFKEHGETVFYDLHCAGAHIQIIGSLALREDVDYPSGADVLFLPYQGRSDLVETADAVLSRLRPKRIIATHFDNAFPPVSQSVDTGGLRRLVAEKYPDATLTIPRFAQPIAIL